MQIEGGITSAEFDEALSKIDTAIEQHGSIRILKQLGELNTPPIPLSKFWDDIKFNFEHLKDITHVAVVSDQSAMSVYVKVLNPLFKAKIKCFKLSELEHARVWLKTAN